MSLRPIVQALGGDLYDRGPGRIFRRLAIAPPTVRSRCCCGKAG